MALRQACIASLAFDRLLAWVAAWLYLMVYFLFTMPFPPRKWRFPARVAFVLRGQHYRRKIFLLLSIPRRA